MKLLNIIQFILIVCCTIFFVQFKINTKKIENDANNKLEKIEYNNISLGIDLWHCKTKMFNIINIAIDSNTVMTDEDKNEINVLANMITSDDTLSLINACKKLGFTLARE